MDNMMRGFLNTLCIKITKKNPNKDLSLNIQENDVKQTQNMSPQHMESFKSTTSQSSTLLPVLHYIISYKTDKFETQYCRMSTKSQ